MLNVVTGGRIINGENNAADNIYDDYPTSSGGRIIDDDIAYDGSSSVFVIKDIRKQDKIYNIQLISTGTTNVNVIVPVAVNWNILEYSSIEHYGFSGGSRIYFKTSGTYQLSYNLLVENVDYGEKVIGATIRRNGSQNILSYDAPIYIGDALGYRSSSNISDYRFNILAGDYIELIYYRIGNDGLITTVPRAVYISLEKM